VRHGFKSLKQTSNTSLQQLAEADEVGGKAVAVSWQALSGSAVTSSNKLVPTEVMRVPAVLGQEAQLAGSRM
jgi:hypothetical protein